MTEVKLRQWLQAAEEPIENPRDYKACRVLADRLAKADADGQFALARVAHMGATGGVEPPKDGKSGPSAKYAINLLARRYPDKWGLHTHQQIDFGSGDEAGSVQILLPAFQGDQKAK